jgi:hypothetical protein
MELSLQSLSHSLHLAYSCAPWLIFVALAFRFLYPVVKGGR